jgi:DNA-binding NarL/FixJ family response regulator
MLVDDHPLIREAVGHLIAESSEFELVGEATARSALSELKVCVLTF